MTSTNSISVVIITHSGTNKTYLENCLRSINSQSTQPDEIVLYAEDETVLPKHEEILDDSILVNQVTQNTEKKLAEARQIAAEVATCSWLLFIDADVEIERNCIEKLKNNISNELFCVGGVLKSFPDEQYLAEHVPWFFVWIQGIHTNQDFTDEMMKLFNRNPYGALFLFNKDVFQEIGGFDTELGKNASGEGELLQGEETDLCLRAHQDTDKTFKLVRDAIGYHHISEEQVTFSYMIRRAFFQGVSKAVIANRTTPELETESSVIKYILVYLLYGKWISQTKPIQKLIYSLLLTVAVGSGFVYESYLN